MKHRILEIERLGYYLAESNLQILENLIKVLPPKYRKSLIAGLKQFERQNQREIDTKVNYICKCGNCADMEGFRYCDKYSPLKSYENYLDYFYCNRCYEYAHIKKLANGKHKNAPDKPISKKAYERKELLKEIQLKERHKKGKQRER